MTKGANRFERAEDVLRMAGRPSRMSELIAAGVNRLTLYEMLKQGRVERLSRGLYCLPESLPVQAADLTIVARRVPKSVVCLISALAFHGITDMIPHEVQVALEHGSSVQRPRLDYPPVRFFWYSGAAFTEGVETHLLDGVPVHIYSAEKTIVDCFKFRNKIGLAVALEALKLYLERPQPRLGELIRFARICRVEKVMRPYLEALV